MLMFIEELILNFLIKKGVFDFYIKQLKHIAFLEINIFIFKNIIGPPLFNLDTPNLCKSRDLLKYFSLTTMVFI